MGGGKEMGRSTICPQLPRLQLNHQKLLRLQLNHQQLLRLQLNHQQLLRLRPMTSGSSSSSLLQHPLLL
jgi:hypothetical protein